jgi:hypothetical protein
MKSADSLACWVSKGSIDVTFHLAGKRATDRLWSLHEFTKERGPAWFGSEES